MMNQPIIPFGKHTETFNRFVFERMRIHARYHLSLYPGLEKTVTLQEEMRHFDRGMERSFALLAEMVKGDQTTETRLVEQVATFEVFASWTDHLKYRDFPSGNQMQALVGPMRGTRLMCSITFSITPASDEDVSLAKEIVQEALGIGQPDIEMWADKLSREEIVKRTEEFMKRGIQ